MAMDYTDITVRKQLNGVTNVDMEEYFEEVEVENLYHWLDRIKFSRPKTNISKDFSDGVLVAEIIHHYFPRMIDLHSYNPANATEQKLANWFLLNRKVLHKFRLNLSDDVMRAMANQNPPKPRVIEKFLMILREQIDKMLERQGRSRRDIDMSLSMDKDDLKSSKALVPASKSTGRSSPEKIRSPRKYGPGEIPHRHPDRSTYLGEGKQPLYEPKLFIMPSTESVPRSLLEEKEMENLAKNETIKILNSKIKRLEELIRLKDIRLEDLHSQLQQVQGMFYLTTNKRYR